jgi:hypothetical protein
VAGTAPLHTSPLTTLSAHIALLRQLGILGAGVGGGGSAALGTTAGAAAASTALVGAAASSSSRGSGGRGRRSVVIWKQSR